MKYNIDEVCLKGETLFFRGWAIPTSEENTIVILIRTKDKVEISYELIPVRRPDVGVVYFNDNTKEDFGFEVTANIKKLDKVFVTFREISHVTGKPIDSISIRFVRQAIAMRTFINNTKVVRGINYFRRNGFNAGVSRILGINWEDYNYQKWFDQHKATKEQLKEQAQANFLYKPKFSIIVPVYNTPLNFLDDMIQSVKKQSYSNWELCLANGSIANEELTLALDKYAKKDERIKYVSLDENLGISGNTNAALALATGEFIALLDHDDMLAPNALYEYVKAINENPEIDAIYSDEDKVDMNGENHFAPYFKSDLNMELLRVNNYICHFFAVRKSLVDQFGGFRSEFDGAQDYDFIFRSLELAREVYHCPEILYHWRSHKDSTAENPESKLYAFEAGKRAIQAHFERLGMNVTTEMGINYGWYRNTFHLEYHPKVTIMIPNKDHIDDLDKCIRSIYEKSTYDNYEVLIIENNSTEKSTFDYYEEAKNKYSNLKIVTWEGPFNYSAINNFGAKFAEGEYLLLLNNDTEVITPDFLEKMLGLCMQKQTGIVGVQLFYEDDTTQHAGVIVGLCGVASHIFLGTKRGEFAYMAKNMVVQNLSAVTAACLMVKKSVYDEVNGLDESFAVAYNDVDFCLRVRKAGYEVVYQPDAQLYHYESKSRGFEDTPEKKARFEGECARFNIRWAEFLKKGDPYYNKNFSMTRIDCKLDAVVKPKK